MRIGSLESGTLEPSRGPRAQMSLVKAVGRSGDQGELDGHFLSVVACARQGGGPHVATSSEFSREARKLRLYVKAFDL